MLLKQISVFVENRHGAIMDITSVLAKEGISIRAISIADTEDFGIVRLLVDKRKDALRALREANMTVKETDVLALEIDDTPGSFHAALKTLNDNNIMIEYCYGFVSPIGGGATIILKCDEQEKALGCLEATGFKLLSADAIKF
jgi:hypothetical protein